MTALKDKIQNALDESRMLVLGAEILIGFEFAATFQEGFRGLSVRSQDLNAIALGLMLITLVLLISPAAYHQIVEKGDDSDSLHRFATHVMEIALLPFAVALGANFYIPAEKINGARTGAIFGLAFTFLAGIFWYGPVFRAKQGPPAKQAAKRTRTTGFRTHSRGNPDRANPHTTAKLGRLGRYAHAGP